MVKNYKKFAWGKLNKCGERNCNKQVDWFNFINYYACENHANQKWGLCEACQTEKVTHNVYYNFHWDDYPEKELKQVKEAPSFQKEIIEKLLDKNISNSLRGKLNAALSRVPEIEKIVPESERLTSEYWEKKINLPNDFIQERGGQQTNLYIGSLCDNCGDEVSVRQQKLKNDYELNALNKLIVFTPEITAQIEKEIGRDEVQEVAYNAIFDNKKIRGTDGFQARYYFLDKLPFFKNEKDVKRSQKKKIFFQKLQKWFQDNQIMQILEEGSSNYIIWYANGNIEVKKDFQLSEWDKLRTFFFNDSQKVLSLHEINNTLKSLDQVPSPSKEEEEKLLGANEEKGGEVVSAGEKKSLSKGEKELIKSIFIQNNIQKIELKEGKLIITNNNNNNNEVKNKLEIKENPQLDLIKNLLQKSQQKSLTYSELDKKDNSQNSPASKPNKSDYVPYLVGGSVGVLIILVGLISYHLGKKRNKK